MKKSCVVGGALLFALGATAADVAPLQPEQASVEKLGAPSPHWIFVAEN